MLKRFYITVTYDLCAHSEYDATGQVFNNRVEPENVEVTELPVNQAPEIEIIPF